jgi:uncharacterized phage-like protein YoqJ
MQKKPCEKISHFMDEIKYRLHFGWILFHPWISWMFMDLPFHYDDFKIMLLNPFSMLKTFNLKVSLNFEKAPFKFQIVRYTFY